MTPSDSHCLWSNPREGSRPCTGAWKSLLCLSKTPCPKQSIVGPSQHCSSKNVLVLCVSPPQLWPTLGRDSRTQQVPRLEQKSGCRPWKEHGVGRHVQTPEKVKGGGRDLALMLALHTSLGQTLNSAISPVLRPVLGLLKEPQRGSLGPDTLWSGPASHRPQQAAIPAQDLLLPQALQLLPYVRVLHL